MAVSFAWLISPILFCIAFMITTSYFIYKLIKSQNVAYSGNKRIRTINVTPCEVTCCMGWLWITCVDKRTNRMALSTFIIWYIINVAIEIFFTVIIFVLFYYQARFDT